MQIELHRHLDICTRVSTLHELGQKQGLIPTSTSLKSFSDSFVLRKPLKNLAEVLGKFELYQKILVSPEIIERIGFEASEDVFLEGTKKIEFRFSPSFCAEFGKLSWKDVLVAFKKGLARAEKKYAGCHAGLICIASRDYGPDSAAETVDFFLKNKNDFIGIDLAGNEEGFPCRVFQEAYAPAVKAGANITIHSGESTGPENIWEAIELLGAKRIGHGVLCLEDSQLVKELAKKNIVLEICPTSNWLTGVCKNLSEHPLPKILEAGVPATLNTDDPSIFGTTLPQEIEICRREMKLSQQQLDKMWAIAEATTFLK